MNPVSLFFTDKSLEDAYNKKAFFQAWTFVKFHIITCTLLAILGLIVSIADYDLTSSIGCLCFGMFNTFTLYKSFNKKVLPNLLMCLIQINLSLIYPYVRWFCQNTVFLSKMESNMAGVTFALFFLSYNFGTSFPMQFFASLFFLLVENVCFLMKYREPDWIQLLSVFAWLSIFNIIYNKEKIHRELFLLQQKQIRYDESLDQIANIGIIYCKLDKRKTSLELVKNNNLSLKMLKVLNSDIVGSAFRNMKLFQLKSKKQQNLHQSKCMNLNLEQYSYHILNQDKKSLKLSKTFKESQLHGNFNKSTFQIRVLETYENNERVLAVFITQLDNNIKLQNSLYKQEIQKQMIVKLGLDIQQLQQIQLKVHSNSQFSQQNRIFQNKIKSIQSSLLIKYFNFRIYLNPKLLLNVSKVSIDNLLTSLKEISKIQHELNILIPEIESRSHFLTRSLKTDGTILRLILLNLIQIISHNRSQQGYLKVSVSQTYNNDLKGNIQLTTFSLSTNIVTIADLFDQSNRQFIQSTMSDRSQKVNLNINLLISQHLVGMIGPYTRIYYTSFADSDQIEIKFHIFNDVNNTISKFNRINQ